MEEIVLYSNSFQPKEEFLILIKSLGYSDFKDLNCRLDKNVVAFVKERAEKYGEYLFYNGIKTTKKLCGFEGVAYIAEVDLSKKWAIRYRNSSIKLTGTYEGISYIDITEGEKNFVKIHYS